MNPRRAITVPLLVASLIGLAACGGEDTETTEADPALASIEDKLTEIEDRLDEVEAAQSEAASEPATEEAPAEEPATEEPATEEHATETTHAAEETTETTEHAADEPPHWSYAGEGGPENWGSLSPDYTACVDGSAQSPIDLSNASAADLEDITFHYTAGEGSIVNNGHTIQVNLTGAGGMTLNEVDYELLQFHFHGPSEHTINGESAPLEVHLVHKNAAGELAVVGVMIQADAANASYDTIVGAAEAATEEGASIGAFDANSLLPMIQSTYRYAGSLTTPPCSEGVRWSVMAMPTQISAEQLDTITGTFHEPNNRPVQPIGDRDLELDITQG
jgi:carbonic anhydrase